MTLRQFLFALVLCGALFLSHRILHASCLAAASQQVTFEVLSCEAVDLGKIHPPSNWDNLASYRGAVLEVNILPPEKAVPHAGKALKLQQVSSGKTRVFYNDQEKKTCEALKPGQKKFGILSWACCDGDPNAPCLLGFAEYVYDLKDVESRTP